MSHTYENSNNLGNAVLSYLYYSHDDFLKTFWGTSKMVPKVKVFAVKPHDLNLFPRTHISEKRKLTPGSPLTSTHMPHWLVNTHTQRHTHTGTYTYMCTYINTYRHTHTHLHFQRKKFFCIYLFTEGGV